jgi:DNA-3-methyladenine glycosylase I
MARSRGSQPFIAGAGSLAVGRSAVTFRGARRLCYIRFVKMARGSEQRRCAWVGEEPLYVAYHDEEWGVPVHDDRLLFEFLVLEGAQAGLSWLTVLKKRESYRTAFVGFEPAKVAGFGPGDIDRLLGDAGIVRNRLKVESAITNARAFLAAQEEFGSFAAYVWRFVNGETIQNEWRSLGEIPAKTVEAEWLSADLRRRGFRFVGPTIVYAHMQATGMVNDHTVDCFRWAELRGEG